jgi:membrane dipeptidase
LSADTADPEDPNPIGLVLLLEGAEGLRAFEDLEEYYERGLRIVGPVWAGGRWCGGTFSPDSMRVTPEGRALLEKLAAQRYILDISHMNTVSANEACDRYEGLVIASHSNCRALLHGQINQRQLSDGTIERLIERDGVMGVIPFNEFLDDSWTSGMQRERVTLGTLAQHIDHICQLAGDADHAAIGSDLDGGFGYPNIPLEMNDISDLPKLEHFLQQRGYTVEDIRKIFHENWMRVLQKGLP